MMLVLPYGTLLVLTPLSGINAPQLTPYSARGLTQTLELLTGGGEGQGAWVKRDVNGRLHSLADTRFRKYRSTITCTDGEAPALDDSWIGVACEVSCCVELSYLQGAVPARPVVPGSTRTQGDVTFYRPLLQMLVTDVKNSYQEWKALNSWSIALEEV